MMTYKYLLMKPYSRKSVFLKNNKNMIYGY